MKKIVLGLFFICTIADASKSNLPNEGKTSSQKSAATTQAVTADDLVQMQRYFKSAYFPLIEDLREGDRVSKDSIKSALEGDTFLTRVHDGGHDTFIHNILPIKFCVVSRKGGALGVPERQGYHADLQIYVNVIKLFFQPVLNMRQAIAALDTMSPAEWKQAYAGKFNEAAHAFNAMTSADWNERIKAQEAAFEEYSRD